MDQLRQMQAFVSVVDTGSFVRAADRMGCAKGVLSTLVMDLEKNLGARLLNRTTRRLSLTASGADYLIRCRQILDDVREANSMASATTQQVNGRLKINAPLTFGNLHLAPLWGEFLRLHPQVELDITLTDRVVDLVDEGYDLAVRITRLADSQLIARKLGSDRMRVCASPGYLKRSQPILEVQDLANHNVAAYSWWSGGDTWAFESLDSGEPQSVSVHPRLRTNSGDTCRAAALAEQGVIFQPGFLVGADIRTGLLQEVLPGWAGPTVDIYAVYPSQRYLPSKVRAMVDFLVDAFKQPGWQ